MAIRSLATMQGDVRERVVVAMREISVLGAHEFKNKALWTRILKLQEATTHKGPLIINEKTIKDSLENTAHKSQKRTYEKHACEIFSIFIAHYHEDAED